jgi:hypothetical protein
MLLCFYAFMLCFNDKQSLLLCKFKYLVLISQALKNHTCHRFMLFCINFITFSIPTLCTCFNLVQKIYFISCSINIIRILINTFIESNIIDLANKLCFTLTTKKYNLHLFIDTYFFFSSQIQCDLQP